MRADNEDDFWVVDITLKDGMGSINKCAVFKYVEDKPSGQLCIQDTHKIINLFSKDGYIMLQNRRVNFKIYIDNIQSYDLYKIKNKDF